MINKVYYYKGDFLISVRSCNRDFSFSDTSVTDPRARGVWTTWIKQALFKEFGHNQTTYRVGIHKKYVPLIIHT